MATMINAKDVARRYTYRVAWEDEDQVFVARVAEWPSLAAHGDSMEAALAELRGVVETCVDDVVAEGKEPPEPLTQRRYSGRFVVRMPPELHRALAQEAAEQDIPINQLVVSRLAGDGGAHHGK